MATRSKLSHSHDDNVAHKLDSTHQLNNSVNHPHNRYRTCPGNFLRLPDVVHKNQHHNILANYSPDILCKGVFGADNVVVCIDWWLPHSKGLLNNGRNDKDLQVRDRYYKHHHKNWRRIGNF